MASGGQPIFIIDPKKEQTKGKEALSMNIAAAKAVASIVKSTLGPRGMDKMLVNVLGDVTITNDGATILHDMSIEHPARFVSSYADTYSQYGGGQYQRYRQMSLDDMLLENRIVFLIGEINYARAAEVIMKMLYLDNLKRGLYGLLA